MITEILTAVGVLVTPVGFTIKQFITHNQRITTVETKQDDVKELILSKLDGIAEKIDLRCDSLDKRVERIERKVLNGEYKSGH